jgi:hypothetical protein
VVTGILALGSLALRIAYPANMLLFAMLMNTLVISTLLLLPSGRKFYEQIQEIECRDVIESVLNANSRTRPAQGTARVT